MVKPEINRSPVKMMKIYYFNALLMNGFGMMTDLGFLQLEQMESNEEQIIDDLLKIADKFLDGDILFNL